MGELHTRKRVRRFWWLVIFGGLAALAAWYWLGGSSNDRGFLMPGAMATPVAVTQARQGTLDRSVHALGTVTAVATVVIRSRVDGPLLAVHFADGQRVQAGDLLAEIDARPFEIQLQQALGLQMQTQAQLDNARRDLTRYEKLFQQESVARQQLDAARTQVRELEGQLRVQQAAVEDARLQLSYTRILAPTDGRLGMRRLDPGNMLHASDADGLVTLTRDQPVDVVFALPQGLLPELQAARQAAGEDGLNVQLLEASRGSVAATGHLIALDNQIDVATGTVRLKSRFDNADEQLFPNQFVQLRLMLGQQSGVLVPLRAVQRGANGEFVYQVNDEGVAHVASVTTSVDDGMQVIIAEGLPAGAQVVIEGMDRLRDGSRVEIVPATDDSTAAAGEPGMAVPAPVT